MIRDGIKELSNWRRIFVSGLLTLMVVVAGLIWSPSAYALTEEQKLFNEAWRVVSQAYVDETFNGQDWWSVRQKALSQPLGDRQSTYTAIQKMLASLDDPFTRLLPPSQYRSLQTSTSGELTGVGLQISTDPATGILQIIAPIEGSPAAAAGLQAGDRILEIDQIPTQTLTLDEAAEKMRGPAGTPVTLKVVNRSPDAEPRTLELTRGHIEVNPVVAELRPQADGHRVGYIRLTQFNGVATEEMVNSLQRLERQGADRYVLDLRNNPGGLLQAGVDIAELWMEPGVVVYTVDRKGLLGSFNTTRQPLTKDPLVVLVNQGTASASEILAGALQDTGRAQLVGDRTFGKGSIQSLFDLSDGAGLAVTIAHYETPAHHNINKVGIEPNQTVSLTLPLAQTEAASKVDTQYQAAIDLLADAKGLVAQGD